MSADAPLLEARNVARRHPDGRQWLLDDVSLVISAGSRVSVRGESGAGKTLLLRALALLDPLDAGQVAWNGRAVPREAIPKFRSAVTYLHQRPVMAGENVETALRRPFSLAVHGRSQFDRVRILRLLEQLGRDGSFLSKRSSDLSGGESQIAALLRAVQLGPAVLLLDEPTAGLDPRAAEAVERLLQCWFDEAPQSRAMVWVTHDRQQAERVGDTTLHISHGRIEDARRTA